MDHRRERRILMENENAKIITTDEAKLLEASKKFCQLIPHEWEPSKREYLESIREALKILEIE